MALRRQPVTRRREQRDTVTRRFFHSEAFPSRSHHPEVGDEGLRKGTEIDRGEGWRARAEQRRVLLPASEILQDSVNLVFFAESLKKRQQVQEFCVIHIVEPGLNRDSIFRMENIGGGGIVDNDDIV